MLARTALCLVLISAFTKARAGSVEEFMNMCKALTGPGTAMCMVGLYSAGEIMALNGLELEKIPRSDGEARQWLVSAGLCSHSDKAVPTGAAMTQAFVNWAEKHPERWADDQASGITAALSATWPCHP